MQTPKRRHKRRGSESVSLFATILGGIACLSVVLQQLLVPLHVAAHEHVYPGRHGGPVLAHADHAHGHEHEGHRHGGHTHGDSDTPHPEAPQEHEPHPAADHLSRLAAPGTASLLHLAPAGEAVAVPFVEGASFSRPVTPDLAPRPPPPRRSAAPRAPPILV